MGQKVSPVGLRVGVNRNWDSRGYANDQDFAGLLHEDIKVRDYILKKLKTASVAKVEIERSKNRVTIFVHTSRPGVVIGKDGEAVDALRKEVSKLVSSKQVFINIVEIKNPDVVEYTLGVVDFWQSEFKIDCLRLDVAYCLDKNFLQTLHNLVSRDFFLLGETLHGDYNQWMNENMLDSVTNYECYKGLYSSFNSANFYEILYSLNRQFGKDPWCLYTGKHLFNFVDNHDVVRVASILEDKNQLPLIYTMLFTMPGIPCIYYGSEWGMEGTKNWNDTDLRPEIKVFEWNALTDSIQRLINLKHTHSALSYGDYTQIGITNTACIYQRQDEKECLWICMNMKNEAQTLGFNGQGNFIDLETNEELCINNAFEFKPYEVRILKKVS